MITTILFDLDGTLLPMDMDEFTRGYFKLLAKKAAPFGYEPQKLEAAIWKGTGAMVKNDGSRSNEEAFWNCFAGIYGQEALKDKVIFDEFYAGEFQGADVFCGFHPGAKEVVQQAREAGLRVVLATNPIFPEVATEARVRWAGLSITDFEHCTTYENSSYCKPNPDYYREVLEKVGCRAEECLMVGNDVEEDMVAETLGMEVFLLTDCLINKEGRDVSAYPHGGFEELKRYISVCSGKKLS